jgi:Spy/CpxP family protein refolding chaperone
MSAQKGLAMNRSLRIVIPLFSMTLLLASSARAGSQWAMLLSPGQGQPQTHSPAPGQKDLNNEKLNLTKEQKRQIRHIRGEFKPQIEAVREDSSLPAQQKTVKLRELHREMHKQVLAVLTPEQKEIMRERQRERHAASKPQFQSKPS